MQDQAFFKDVMGRIGCDLRRAEGLTFAVFQELRDRITPQEALHVAAQLPKRLKMMWMSLEHPDRKVHRVHGDQFIWEVRRMAGLADDAEACGIGRFRGIAEVARQPYRPGRRGLGRDESASQGSEEAMGRRPAPA